MSFSLPNCSHYLLALVLPLATSDERLSLWSLELPLKQLGAVVCSPSLPDWTSPALPIASKGPHDGHPYSLLLDLTQPLIVLHDLQSPRLSTAFQTWSLQCRSSLDLLHLPQCSPVLAFQLPRQTTPWLIFTLAPAVVPGTFSRAVRQPGSHFSAVLVCEVILPHVQNIAVLLIKLWEIPLAVVHRFLKLLWIKTLPLNV